MQNQDQLILNVQHLEKRFGENLVLRDIDFQVRPGQVTSIIGSSGSGKSAKSNNAIETFLGKSITTGPLRPVFAIWKASFTMRGISRGSCTW